ncbi:uncharacterized protein LOC134404593 [Elgaria multicarinata webbii]|uniref:uncharacterized protein LOC134404593 n=1 Tax=Elgaria multicarinata webbii TaxID=159646 RepID=UPI002FCD00BF
MPVDNLTDKAQEASIEQKHLVEPTNDRKPEGTKTTESNHNFNGRHGNTRNWDLHEPRLEFIVDNEIPKGDIEIDGSGDAGFPSQVDTHHGIDTGNEHHGQVKDYQVTTSINNNTLWGKDKDGQSMISSTSKPTKDGYIKIGVKKNEAYVIQEINPYSYIPKKIKDPQSKDYSKVTLKGKTIATDKELGRKEDIYTDLLDNRKKDNITGKTRGHLNLEGNLSRDLQGKTEHIMKGDYTNVSSTKGTKEANEKDISNATVHKGKDKDIMIIKELNGQKDRSGATKPHKKGEVGGGVISGSHVKVAGTIKLDKRDGAREDIIDGKPKSQMEPTRFSKTHTKEEGDAAITGRLLSQVEDPVYTKTGKTNRSGVILSEKLNSHVDGFGVTKTNPKGEVNFLRRISGSQISGPGEIQQGGKGASEVDITPRKSNIGEGDLGFPKAHRKEVSSPEKINRKGHESSPGDPEMHERDKTRFGVPFQEVNKDTVKGSISYSNPAAETAADLRRSNIDPSDRKAEHRGQKTIQLKSALSLSHGSHKNSQGALNIPKDDKLKNPEHSSFTTKISKKLKKPSKKIAKTHTGTDGGNTAKQHFGNGRRKISRHGKKRHRSDSSQSSESEGNSRYDSRQSYEDYQNDKPDSYQSSESTEDNLSVGSSQSDGHTQMED